MQTPDEGYLKYNQQHIHKDTIELAFGELILYRNKLAALNLIGVYPDKIGFGNISARNANGAGFIISGTQTGQIPLADEAHFALVTNADIKNNTVYSEGPVQASSESLTHAAIYNADENITCVMHVHHQQLWQLLLNNVATVSSDIAYGTPEMAEAIRQKVNEINTANAQKIIVTAGHKDGILTYGKDIGNAYNVLMQFYAAFQLH